MIVATSSSFILRFASWKQFYNLALVYWNFCLEKKKNIFDECTSVLLLFCGLLLGNNFAIWHLFIGILPQNREIFSMSVFAFGLVMNKESIIFLFERSL